MTTESASHRGIARRLPTASALALLGSLCLNIGLAGYIAVQAPTADSQEPVHRAPDAVIATFAAHLPSQDADILWRIYRSRQAQIQAADVASQQARLRVVSVLAQRDLDTDLLRATFKEALESQARMQDLLFDAAIEALQQISPDGRLQLIKQSHLPTTLRPQR
ncbi:MAG TPA: periplasmic heavy metal sensor [Xanthobacteraceae bacterium]|nr:periplasmic heavy metal sensor [Xanthobacteraceae bacterium]